MISVLDRKKQADAKFGEEIDFFPPRCFTLYVLCCFLGSENCLNKITVGLRELLKLNCKSFSVLREEE